MQAFLQISRAPSYTLALLSVGYITGPCRAQTVQRRMVAHPRLHKSKSAWPPLYSHQPTGCAALPLGLFCDIWVAVKLSWWHWLLRSWRWVMIYLQWYWKRGEVHTDCTVLFLGQTSVSLCLSVCLSVSPSLFPFFLHLSFSFSLNLVNHISVTPTNCHTTLKVNKLNP